MAVSATILIEATKDLRKPYQDAIRMNGMMRTKGDLGGLAQIITGSRQSGKTTEANDYAEAIARAGIVDKQEVVRVYGGDPGNAGEWVKIFKSAEGGVLIIDEPYKAGNRDGGRFDVLWSLMVQSFDDPKHVLVLTGDTEPMKKFIAHCAPELQARMPKPIETERTYGEEEIRVYNRRRREQRLAREEAERQAAEVSRSKEEWRQMSEDVTLKKAAAPMKGIVLVRKNETVS